MLEYWDLGIVELRDLDSYFCSFSITCGKI